MEPGERLESNIGSTAHTTMYNIHERQRAGQKWNFKKMDEIVENSQRTDENEIHTHTHTKRTFELPSSPNNISMQTH